MTQPRLSASRLNEYLGCAHAAALWLDGVTPPDQTDAGLELVRKKGFEHEAHVLARLEATYGKAVAIPDKASASVKADATRSAMAAGAPLIYQAALFNERWVGFPDFLVRTGEAEDGRPTYEPEDAKLATRAKAEHVIQLGIYRKLIVDFGGVPGPGGTIHVGGGKAPERFRLEETDHITGRYMAEFEAFADAQSRTTRPLPTGACGRCAYKTRCETEWREADSPTFVAGLRSDQLLKLGKAGLTTLQHLADLSADARVPGISDEALRKLAEQASLQAQARETGEHVVEPLPHEPGRGFGLLPPPAAGDLFFDMEGYPHDPGGLEYLLGLFGPLGPAGEDRFKGIWAHNAAEEKLAFEELMDLFVEHLRQYPSAHIYHYAAYETVALKKLASRYATREAELDQLLRERRFVDLYRVAKQGLRASTESYSLKALEKIYWGKRAGEVTNAGDSIVEYERWRETGDPAILESIERYNDDDCVSTAKLREWLESLRPDGAVYDGGEPAVEEPDAAADERRAAREAFEARRRNLAERVRASGVGSEAFRDLVAELLWFHQRANKPQWWSLFDRQTWSDEELIEDIDGLGGLELVAQQTLPKPARSDLATYRFPPQETKLRVGQSCKIAATLEPAGVIQELDAAAGLIVLKRGSKAGEYPQTCGISPDGPIDQNGLVEAIVGFAERVAAGDLADDQALVDLLLRAAPRIAGGEPGRPILREGEDLVPGVVRAVRALQNSHLFIQGPPGTGKTYTSSHAILQLLKGGARVAVASNSHKAINNLLEAVEKRAEEDGFALVGVKKATRGDPETEIDGKFIANVYSSSDAAGYPLVGGTAFHFCKSEREFDYLFVDEAGQVCLANLVAMAGCARNIVLIGDQMQLPQPVQGVHPGETGLSCLDYLLQGRATVPPELGVLLNISWRMHPGVCSLISEAVYEGRLSSHATAEARAVLVEGFPGAGVVHMPIAHEGCRQASRQEAEAIADLVQRLLSGRFRDEYGEERAMELADVLVVAPYNLQVNLLKEHLPQGIRVGTVDKFQGQEAPVVVVSMATSRGSDAPRGTEFLFNKNRLNVAISRAMCLAFVVASDRLLEGAGGTVADLARLDLIARIEAGEARSA
ncbi:TM0106 family RecB-like putative nuclease [Phenylobacterium sp.]|uniref:TM0106 family RecB-like putative nuclease n=1 Tax=Phenylobacterium sp. TaxID=1871053 RepID=UPI0035ADB94B